MTAHQAIAPTSSSRPDRTGRLFFLDLASHSVLAINPDGSGREIVVSGAYYPDGIAVDVEAGHIYWTNMGIPSRDEGSIERADFDGSNRVTIIPKGVTWTPKQMQLEKASGKIYWSDREGMRVMRANLDGSDVEVLVETGHGDADRRDQSRWCVGIAVDPEAGKFYWTQKGPDNGDVGRLLRAALDLPAGESAASRSDIEIILDRLPEPIDLEIDHGTRLLYWTDRGDAPRGNSVNRIPLDGGSPELLFGGLMEGIAIALDRAGGRMFVTDLTGTIHKADLDGGNRGLVAFTQGNITGIAFAEIPTE